MVQRPSPSTSSPSRRTLDGTEHEKYTWCNSAYAMATNITRAFKLFGWCSNIRGVESGGAVEGLPAHTFPDDDGGVAMKCPTEIAISDRREAELAKNGFMPLIFRKNSDFAAFIGAQSLQKPQEYQDPAATANANLSARLPYLFASCRFAHYLKCMVRDKIGASMSKTAAAGLAGVAGSCNTWMRSPDSSSNGVQGEPSTCGWRGGARGERGKSRLLQRQVLPQAALPTRGTDCFTAPCLRMPK